MTTPRKIRPLLGPKSKYRIGSWNVRTVFQTGKTAQMERETGQRHITTVIKQKRLWKLLGHVSRKDRDSITQALY